MIEKQEDDVRAKEAAMVPPGKADCQWLPHTVTRCSREGTCAHVYCVPPPWFSELTAHADDVGITECSGMRLLPENERLETLSVLQKNRSEIERALQSLPLKIETLGQIRRRDEMERRMREIEEGLKVFCRPKVLVKL